MTLPINISITGPFEAFELGEIAALLRHIDNRNRNPDRFYAISIRGGPEADQTLEEAERVMRTILPEAPERHTVITVHRTKHAP